MFEVTPAWKSTYPEAHVGVLVMRAVFNPAHHAELENQKAALEDQLHAQFSGQDRAAIASHPIFACLRGILSPFQEDLSHPTAA
jgi:hypothetical protein